MKKAQGMSLNVIIVAAIALVVLIVLIAIFSGKISLFGKGYDTETARGKAGICTAAGGVCGSCFSDEVSASTKPSTGWIDCSANQNCCIGR